jgi:hypothetical protein
VKTLPFLLGAAACQSAAVPADLEAAACSVTIRFGSYAMGIDTASAAAVDNQLADNEDVTSVARSGAGREGEYALCVSTRDTAAAARLVDRITALLPLKPRGPITVEGAGRRFEAPAR